MLITIVLHILICCATFSVNCEVHKAPIWCSTRIETSSSYSIMDTLSYFLIAQGAASMFAFHQDLVFTAELT